MKNRLRSSARFDERNNFAFLAVALVLLLSIMALDQEIGLVSLQPLVGLALIAAMAAGVWSMRGDRRWLTTRMGLAVASMGVLAVRTWAAETGLDLAWVFVVLVYVVWTTWTAMHLVLFSGPVDWNKIIGSFCIYLLLGIIWALLYLVVAVVNERSFVGIAAGQWRETFPSLIYFSFITMTTAGYGDIQPVLPAARFLAYMEAVVGQFYMAVLVASLVGSALSNRRT